MPDAASPKRHERPAAASRPEEPPEAADGAQELEQLRRLLLANEQERLEQLQRDVEVIREHHDALQVEDVCRLLPEAVVLRTGQDDQLAQALAPTIEETLTVSVQRDPQPLVDALFPVIGPAIRKSISEALSATLEAVNRTLEQGLSVRSIRWRIEAARTGKSFSEIVLAHTLLFRVEQLFLIEAHTGLPLQHVAAEAVQEPEGALVAGMLTAIQDFARDSFGADGEETLDALELGDLVVWVERGPRCQVAAVIRGIPDPALRDVLKDLVETVHLRFIRELSQFDGDPAPFDPARPLLASGLQSRYRDDERKTSPTLWVVGLLVAAALAPWGFFTLRDHLRWEDYLARLEAEPGIVVTGTGWEGGRRAVWGLRDPLAVAPESLLAASKLKGEAVQGVWEPYQALAPPILVRRAARLLEAPPSVTLRMAGGVLQAAGTAPRAWRLQARERVPFLAGLAGYDDTALVDAGVERLFQLADSLEQQAVFFEGGGAALVPGQGDALAAQAALVQTLIETGTAAGRTVRLRIVGHASTEGTEERNLSVSQARAALVRQALARRGVPPEGMDAVGTGTAELPHAERTEADRALNRRISYHVRFEEAPQ